MDNETIEYVTEYAAQVVPVGQLDPQQLVTGLRCPPGYDPIAAQIVPVVVHMRPTVGELVSSPRGVSGICFVWKRIVPVPVSPASAGVAR